MNLKEEDKKNNEGNSELPGHLSYRQGVGRLEYIYSIVCVCTHVHMFIKI